MQSRRRSICCASLVLLAIPTSGLANGISVTITTGTTIEPPAALDLGSGRSGEELVSEAIQVAWLSNDAGMAVSVVASDLRCDSPRCRTGAAPDTIHRALMALRQPGPDASLDGLRSIARIVGHTGEAREDATIELSLLLPQARPGRYSGTLSFMVVNPTALTPDDCGAGGEAALAWSVVSPPGCDIQPADLPPGALRVAATAAGSTTITTPVTVTVQ